MIRLVVKEVARKEGISNPSELAEKAGLPYESCRLLWNGLSRRVDLGTIEKLCIALRVWPGQLFEFEPNVTTSRSDVSAGRKRPPKASPGKRIRR
jgi:DNA-binding Xre family transcriptional regulator